MLPREPVPTRAERNDDLFGDRTTPAYGPLQYVQQQLPRDVQSAIGEVAELVPVTEGASGREVVEEQRPRTTSRRSGGRGWGVSRVVGAIVGSLEPHSRGEAVLGGQREGEARRCRSSGVQCARALPLRLSQWAPSGAQ